MAEDEEALSRIGWQPYHVQKGYNSIEKSEKKEDKVLIINTEIPIQVPKNVQVRDNTAIHQQTTKDAQVQNNIEKCVNNQDYQLEIIKIK